MCMQWLKIYFESIFLSVIMGLSLSGSIIQDTLIKDFPKRSLLTGDLITSYENGYSFGFTVNQWLRTSQWTKDSKYIITSATPSNTNGFALAVFTPDLGTIVCSTYIPSDNSYTSIPGLSVVTTGTAGITYIAIPTQTSDHNNKVSVYKFNEVALQLLPQSTIQLQTDLYQPYVAWSPNGQYLAVVQDSSLSTYAFDGSTMTFMDSIEITAKPEYSVAPEPGQVNIHSLSWSYDGSLIAVLDLGGNPLLYTFNGSEITTIIGESGNVYGSYNSQIAFHPSKKIVAITNNLPNDYYQYVLLYAYTDDGTLTLLQTINTEQANDNLYYSVGLAWSSDGNYLAAGSYDFKFYSFDGQTAQNIPSATISGIFTGNGSHPGVISWSPDGMRLVITGQHGLYYDQDHSLINSQISVYTTSLIQVPTLAEAQAKAPATLTNIVTSTADQFWGINGGDLMFSSTEANISRLRGTWVPAQSQGMLSSGNIADLLMSTDGNFYTLDQLGGAYVSDSVIVGPQVRINWRGLSAVQGGDPLLTKLYQGPYGLMGSDRDNIFYRYRPMSGWLLMGA